MPPTRHQTIKDVAERAQVSTATVSRVINRTGKVHAKTAARVTRALEELGYVPNAWARAMATDGSDLMGLIVPDILNPFFAAIYSGLNETAKHRGLAVWMVDSGDNPEKERQALHMLGRYRAQGIIITPAHPAANLAAIERIGTPVCLVDRRLAKNLWDLVLIDNVNGARQAAQLFVAAGHQRIAIIAGPQDSTPGVERLQGFVDALAAEGLDMPPEYIKFGDFRQESGFSLARELLALDAPPTAIFSCNNLMTMGLLQAIHSYPGAVLGETVAVIGFDDIPISTLTDPPLTVVSRPMKEMGVQAAKLITARMEAPEKPQETVVLGPQLVIRGSEKIAGLLRWI
jgi:DNA-binding LacI/PurR family transcriptional regulator